MTYEFSLAVEDLECDGACDPAFVLGDVGAVRIISSANGMSRRGDAIVASVGVDLITAVPEPAMAQLGGAALAALTLLVRLPLARRRWRRSSD
jgi:hypothetical protein